MANDREPGSSEMVDRAPEEGTEPLSARVISYVFVAFLLGSEVDCSITMDE